MTVRELLYRLYGVNYRERINDQVSVMNIAKQRIAVASANRASLLVINNSLNTMYILPANDVATTKSFIISPSGSMLIQWFEDGELSTLEWWGMASGNGSNCTIVENIIQ